MILCWSFGTYMSFDTVRWHFYLGYLILGLMIFRIIWGLIGPAPIRFSALIHRPSALFQYLKTLQHREPSGTAGHNPLGSLSIIIIVLTATALALTGLFIETDDFFEYGPLNKFVSESTADLFNSWHELLADMMVALVVLHVAALAFYLLWKKENLIKPMITGWKWVRRN